MMTPDERTAIALRLFELNKSMASLRIHIEAAAELAKDAGETGLAFATYHLSESIAVYTTTLNRFIAGELVGDE